jgi:uncharacterized protein (TIGR04222 family)
MIELLGNIPGPYFLLVYFVFSVVIIIIAKIIAGRDSTRNMEIPEPSRLSPLEMAFLSKGVKGAVIVSIFNLWKKKKIEIKQGKNSVILNPISNDFSGLNNIESHFLMRITGNMLYQDFFYWRSLKNYKGMLQPNIDNLKNLNLFPTNEIKIRYWIAFLVSAAILIGFGGTKLLLGISRDKPVAFLFILITISIIALFYIIKPHKVRFTALGRKFIASSSKRFEWLKMNDSNALLEDDNLLYGVALFGISAFIGSIYGKCLAEPRLLETYAHIDQGSSCSGTSCSGGGCGGGGGGGGCGGCGGGGD